MGKNVLEICVDSVESAIAADRGGASRVELCQDLVVGGITPSIALFERIRETTDIPIHVLLRPRFGDFLYSEEEFNVLCKETELFQKAGADALVVGCVTPEGCLDKEKIKQLKHLAKDTKLCLHRAFDMCRDLMEALEIAKELEIDTILTSGGENSALEGMEMLRKLHENAGEVNIMAGAGVTEAIVREFVEKTSLTYFHMSGKIMVESEMEYRNPRVSMGIGSMSEYQIIRTSEEEVRKVCSFLKVK